MILDDHAKDELEDHVDEQRDDDEADGWLERLRSAGLPVRAAAVATSTTSSEVKQLVADSWSTPTERFMPTDESA